jgi:drug/metabolite transporter (DMT)-like permease
MKQITQLKPNSIGLMAALFAAATWGMVGIFVRWLPGWSAFAVLSGRFLVATAVMLPIVLLVPSIRSYSLPPHSTDLVAEFAGDWVFLSGHYGISNGTRGGSYIIIYDFTVVYYCL